MEKKPMRKKLVFRIRKSYFDAIIKGDKNIEYRRDIHYWQIRIANLFPDHFQQKFFDTEAIFRVYGKDGVHGKDEIEGVFICGKRKHSRLVLIIERIHTPSFFSKQGKKDVDTKNCLAFHLGREVYG
jgi:hypothetical protein